LRFLAEASEQLGESLDYDLTLSRVTRLAVPYLADWCTVDLLEPDGRIHRVTAAQDAASRAAEVAADRHLPKPFDFDDLFRVIEAYGSAQ